MQLSRYAKRLGLVSVFVGIGVVFFSSCNIGGLRVITKKDYSSMIDGKLNNIEDVKKLFPLGVEDIKARFDFAIEQATKDYNALLSVDDKDRNFENTVRVYDELDRRLGLGVLGIIVTKYVHPDKVVRDVCNDISLKLSKFMIDKIVTVELYKAFKAYEPKFETEKLTDEERYYFTESMKGFKKAGLHLPPEKLAQVKKLKKEIAALSIEFSTNIAEDNREVLATKEDLAGVDQHFVDTLKRKDGNYVLRCDIPTYMEIMKHCSVENTRRDMERGFQNRGYPKNKEILESIIAKRDELAKLLGFKSYADIDLEEQMAKNVKTVDSFIRDLLNKVSKKEQKEFELLASDLPEGVKLVNNKFNRWDILYAQEAYKKKKKTQGHNKVYNNRSLYA